MIASATANALAMPRFLSPKDSASELSEPKMLATLLTSPSRSRVSSSTCFFAI
jgi:hypothetical protein